MYICALYCDGIPVPKKSTSCMTHICDAMVFVNTQVLSTTILEIVTPLITASGSEPI